MVFAKCCSPFPWFGGNRKTTHPIVTFVLNNTTGITPKSKHTVKYQDLPSTTKPFPYRYEFPVPNHPENQTFSNDNSDSGDDHEQRDCWLRSDIWSKVFLIWTTLINTRRFYLVCDFNLSKKQTGLLSSILKTWNLLHQNTKIYFFSHRQQGLKNFSLKKTIWYFEVMSAL